jgi:twitching motility protein PilT
MTPQHNALRQILQLAVEREASDIHFVANEKAKFRIKDKLIDVGKNPIPADFLAGMLISSMKPEQVEEYRREKEIDYGLRLENVGRFRVNMYTSQGNTEAVLRVIKEYVADSKSLNLPSVIEDFATLHDGLVLISGSTGSGKSTTLAAMINHVNNTVNKRIITIEDPVELVHRNNLSVISQREVGEDTVSYHRALKSLMRQNPDIILIGEIRDKDTATSALQAAQTGHLVLSTIHASSAEETVSRFAGLYPSEERANIKQMLSYTLKGVIAQRLIVEPITKNKIPVMEIMKSSKRVQDSILADSNDNVERETLLTIIRDERIYGSQTLDQYLIDLVLRQIIPASQAITEAANTLWMRQELQTRGLSK